MPAAKGTQAIKGMAPRARMRTMSAVDVTALTAGAAASRRTSGAQTAACGATAAPNSSLATCVATVPYAHDAHMCSKSGCAGRAMRHHS